ncbi:MAG TPA: hypothetical protein VND68_14935 [Chloroflexia bacterium]|nr:hypothetical protein [Chloroflexia bacterium]
MEPDGLDCGGTFVEFSWHSFETDGEWDAIAPKAEGAELVGVAGDRTETDDGVAEPAKER